MPLGDFIPATDLGLRQWATNYVALVTATPGAYGLVAADATAAGTAATQYATALTLSSDPNTRTAVTVQAKDTARNQLVTLVRSQVTRVQAYPPLTPAQAQSLGITVRSTIRTQVPPPSTRPILAITKTEGGVMTLRVSDELAPDSRKMPPGVIGVQVFAQTGSVPPISTRACEFLGMFGRGVIALDVSSYDVGDTVYLLARWQNRRGQTGPQSVVVSQIRTS